MMNTELLVSEMDTSARNAGPGGVVEMPWLLQLRCSERSAEKTSVPPHGTVDARNCFPLVRCPGRDLIGVQDPQSLCGRGEPCGTSLNDLRPSPRCGSGKRLVETGWSQVSPTSQLLRTLPAIVSLQLRCFENAGFLVSGSNALETPFTDEPFVRGW